MERSFHSEIEALKLGQGEIFQGEGILAVTKALLQSGVTYVGGYQGSPISHLMDVLADAQPILEKLGVYFEPAASEAAAARVTTTGPTEIAEWRDGAVRRFTVTAADAGVARKSLQGQSMAVCGSGQPRWQGSRILRCGGRQMTGAWAQGCIFTHA